MGSVKGDLSSQRALALDKPLFYLLLQSARAVDALDLGVNGDFAFAFAACSFSGSTLANGGGLTSALQCNVGLILFLCGF
jgi:hypothetical protein